MINNLSDKRIRCVCLHLSIFTFFFSSRRKKKPEGNKSTHYASISQKKVEGNLLFFFLRSRVHHEILDFRSNFHYFEACIRWNASKPGFVLTWKLPSPLQAVSSSPSTVQTETLRLAATKMIRVVSPRWSVGFPEFPDTCLPVYSQPGIGCLFRGPRMNHQQVS